MSEEHHMRLAPRLDSVQKAQDFITHWAEHYGLDDNGIHYCMLSVEEIITNVVEHGFDFDENAGFINVMVQRDGDTLVIEISDNGPLFNPLMHPEPDPTLPLWERKGGGWGIHFVKQFMDSAQYHSTGGLNHLRMEKRLAVG